MKSFILEFTIILVVFLVFPLGGVILGFYFALTGDNRSRLWIFAITMALYISFINASKVVNSDPDLPWYTEQYKMAGRMGYVEYIFWFGLNGKGRELFFPTFNYIVYMVIGDNLNLYRFFHSLVCYLLAFWAIIRMGNFMKLHNCQLTIAIVWMACMPWIFTYSQTILRQFLANAFLLVIIVERFLYRKKMILLSSCMVLSHTSAFLFLPFLYVPFFHKALTRKTAFFYCMGFLMLAFIQTISQYALSMTDSLGDNALTYALDRASVDTEVDLPPLGIGKITLMVAMSFFCIYIYYNKKYRSIILPTNADSHIGIINIVVLLCGFIISNSQQPELCNRLFSYAAMLSVFPVIYLVAKFRYFYSVKIAHFSFYFMQLMLLLYFTHSMFEYAIPYGIMFFPIQYIL